MKSKSGAKVSVWPGLAVIAAAALALRCVQLGDRPMHTDEAVHAVVLGDMLQTGVYRYNPHDSHGPLLYDLSYPALRVLGLRDLADLEAWHLRLISALVGGATILLLAFWAGDLGANAVLFSALLFALAAPFVYYQRYFIHEGLFVLLTLALLRCVWSLVTKPSSARAAWGTGLVLALLFATKETAPLVVVAMALAGIGAWLTRTSGTTPFRLPNPRLILPFSLGFLVVFVLLYTSFGTNLAGLSDVVAGDLRFLHRAGGEGHEKPWWTCFAWLLAPHFYSVPWSGWIIFPLALVAAAFRWSSDLIRALFFFTLALAFLYSAIPYKTPWLELNLLAPAVLLSGVGAVALWEKAGKSRAALVLVALAAFLVMGRETLALCYVHPVDPRNPLAYSPTVPDIDNLTAAVTRLKASYPADDANIIEVISTDYWPLPWYLRRLPPVGYWSEIPPQPISADIVITSPDLLPALQARLGPGWTLQYFGLRPDVLAVVLSKPAPHD